MYEKQQTGEKQLARRKTEEQQRTVVQKAGKSSKSREAVEQRSNMEGSRKCICFVYFSIPCGKNDPNVSPLREFM